MRFREILRSLFFGSGQVGEDEVQRRTNKARQSLESWANNDLGKAQRVDPTDEEIEMLQAWQKQVMKATKQYEYDPKVIESQMAEAERNKNILANLSASERFWRITKK